MTKTSCSSPSRSPSSSTALRRALIGVGHSLPSSDRCIAVGLGRLAQIVEIVGLAARAAPCPAPSWPGARSCAGAVGKHVGGLLRLVGQGQRCRSAAGLPRRRRSRRRSRRRGRRRACSSCWRGDKPVAHADRARRRRVCSGKAAGQPVDGLDQRGRLARAGKQRRHLAVALVLGLAERFVAGTDQAQQGARASSAACGTCAGLLRLGRAPRQDGRAPCRFPRERCA